MLVTSAEHITAYACYPIFKGVEHLTLQSRNGREKHKLLHLPTIHVEFVQRSFCYISKINNISLLSVTNNYT